MSKKTLSNPTCMCAYCGREFIRHLPHRCNTGYRKHKMKWIDYNIEKRENDGRSEVS